MGSWTVPGPLTGGASFVKTDTITQGNWKGVYGADGYNVIDDAVSYPPYVTVTPNGNSNYVWASSTADPRAHTISITDANGTVLDSRSMSGFNAGQYLVWNLSGHVRLVATWTAGYNAVISGLFSVQRGE